MRVSDNAHLVAWGEMWKKAKELLETKTPENVVVARDLFLNLLVIDDTTNEQGVLFNIARCEAILGNVQAAVTFLSKIISSGCTDPTPIEQCDDLKTVRQTEACQTLLALLKKRATSDPFLQYYVSTLRCVDLDTDEMNKCKWPVSEAKKAEGKKV